MALALTTPLACGGAPEDNAGAGSANAAAGDKTPASVCKRIGELIKSTDVDACTSEYASIKSLEPKAFTCLANCAELKDEAGFNLCKGACTKVSLDLQARESVAKQTAEFGGDGMLASEWQLTQFFLEGAAAELKASLETSGAPVKIKIKAVEGMLAPKETSVSAHFAADPAKHDPATVNTPSITIDLREGTAKDALGQILQGIDASDKVLKKESDETSYVAHAVGESAVRVYTGRVGGGKVLACEGLLVGRASVIKKDIAIAALEKMCRSAETE